jgi:hypothetical protein
VHKVDVQVGRQLAYLVLLLTAAAAAAAAAAVFYSNNHLVYLYKMIFI